MAVIVNAAAFVNWCQRAARLLDSYCKKADTHWDNIENMATEGKDITFDITHFGFPARGERYSGDLAAKDTAELCKLISEIPQLNLPSSHRQKADREAIVLKMYLNLGLWLGTYFHGAVRFDLWDEVMVYSRQLGTFPGDAFFDKLGGDLFRYERIFLFGKGWKILIAPGRIFWIF